MRSPALTGMVLGGGRYQLGELLGEGAFGAVYAATQTDLGRAVAIKVLHIDAALEPAGLARFEREAKAAAALGHPNIAQVTDFQANPGEPPFLVMERLTGQTLGAHLGTSGRMAPARVVHVASQMLAALDAAHRAGIVHRDVKPDNIFLVAATGVQDMVKLLDFGIAKLSAEPYEKLTATGAVLGSPAYMAPEQIQTLTFDHRVDLYAVGATMYRAIAGRFPFEAPTLHAMLVAITAQRAAPLAAIDPSVDPQLSALVERAMHKDPMGRFATAAEMRDELERIAAGRRSALVAPTPALVSATAPLMPPLARASHAPSMAPPPRASHEPSLPPPTPRSGPHPAQHAYSVPPPTAASGYPPSSGALGPPASASAAHPASGGATGVLVAIIVVLVVLLLGGAGIVAYLFLRKTSDDPAALPSGAATSAAPSAADVVPTSEPASPSPPTSGAQPVAPTPTPGVVPRARTVDAGVTATDAGGQPAPSALPAPADAGAPRKQMAGPVPRVSGGIFDKWPVDKGRAAVERVMPALTACYAATEFEPPDHQFTVWVLTVDAAGNVRSAAPKTAASNHPRLAPCVVRALMASKWEPTPGGGSPEIHLSARTRDNP